MEKRKSVSPSITRYRATKLEERIDRRLASLASTRGNTSTSVAGAHNTEINSPAADIPICINRRPICILNSNSKPQQMPDCGFVSLTRRLAVTAGYNSRDPPVKGSLLTARPNPPCRAQPAPAISSRPAPSSSSSSSSPNHPVPRHPHLATLPVTLGVMRI